MTVFSPLQKRIILDVVTVFETGKRYLADCAAVSLAPDGPEGIRQISYGMQQAAEFGSLSELIDRYVANNGRFASQFEPYRDRLGVVPLSNDKALIALLQKAGEEDPVMERTQRDFFDRAYWRPARLFCRRNGLEEALSLLVVYDSYIQSGGILSFLRKRFAERPPAQDGNERAWTESYVKTRHQWLSSHFNPVVRATSYRTKTFLREVKRENWTLTAFDPLIVQGVKIPTAPPSGEENPLQED